MLSTIRKRLWKFLVLFYPWLLRKVYGMSIGEGTRISQKAVLDRSINPKGIIIGDYTLITRECMILAHDASRRLQTTTRIGSRCFIGVRSIILPGVTIGDEVIVGAGSVVTKDIPSHCIIAGNPARIIKENVACDAYGKLKEASPINH